MDNSALIETYGNHELPEGTADRPLVTFALFAYNQEQYIREAVEGAFSQTYSPLEIILSDDCSSDRTFDIMCEMAREYRGPHRVRLRQNSMNLGLAGHINSIVESASGGIICWAAGDDISLPLRTEVLTKPMLDDSGTIGVHSAVREIDISGELLKLRFHDLDVRNITLDSIITSGRGVVSQAHAFRKVVFDRFGPLQNHLTNEGPAMAFRECLLGRVVYIEEPTVLYRVGSGTSTYSGNNLHSRKKLEPIKYSTWRLTAVQQMLNDLPVVELTNHREVHAKLVKMERYYKNLLNINSGHRSIVSLMFNMWIMGYDEASFRAFARVYCPNFIYSLFYLARK